MVLEQATALEIMSARMDKAAQRYEEGDLSQELMTELFLITSICWAAVRVVTHDDDRMMNRAYLRGMCAVSKVIGSLTNEMQNEQENNRAELR